VKYSIAGKHDVTVAGDIGHIEPAQSVIPVPSMVALFLISRS
jgi:hypothetical protein